MNINHIVVIAILAVLAVVVGLIVKKDDKPDNYLPPEAAPVPKEFGFYSSMTSQLETLGFTSLWWSADWEGPEKRLSNIIAAVRAGNRIVLDVSGCFFDPAQGGKALFGNSAERLRNLLSELRFNGVLKSVAVLYPKDEPNLRNPNVCDLMPEVVAICRSVAAEFGHDTEGVMVGVIFSGNREFCDVSLYDLVGFDDYDERSGILRPGRAYDQMAARLRPDQKTWLIPGGTDGQDPVPFMNFAYAHPEVWAIVAFAWADDLPRPAGEKWPGISATPYRDMYVAAGKKLTGKS